MNGCKNRVTYHFRKGGHSPILFVENGRRQLAVERSNNKAHFSTLLCQQTRMPWVFFFSEQPIQTIQYNVSFRVEFYHQKSLNWVEFSLLMLFLEGTTCVNLLITGSSSKCRIWIFHFGHFQPIFVLLKVISRTFFGIFNELLPT